jgi:hypothetical protein
MIILCAGCPKAKIGRIRVKPFFVTHNSCHSSSVRKKTLNAEISKITTKKINNFHILTHVVPLSAKYADEFDFFPPTTERVLAGAETINVHVEFVLEHLREEVRRKLPLLFLLNSEEDSEPVLREELSLLKYFLV